MYLMPKEHRRTFSAPKNVGAHWEYPDSVRDPVNIFSGLPNVFVEKVKMKEIHFALTFHEAFKKFIKGTISPE
jgi:hypothetical protein